LDAAMQAARRSLGAFVGEDGTLSGLVREGGVDIAVGSGRGCDRARLQEAARALVGQAGIARVTVDDPNAPPAGVAQANAAHNAALRRRVGGAAGAEGLRVLELYAGDGNFTRDLAAVAKGGVAVEADRPAVARLTRLLSGMNVHTAWRAVAEPAARAVA